MSEEVISTGGVTEEFARDFVRRDYAAWNAHDVDAALAITVEDVVLEGTAVPNGRIQGHDAYRDWMRWMWQAAPDFALELVEDSVYLSPQRPRASWIYRATGSFTGPMDPPGFAPTGRRIEMLGVDVWEFRGGLGSYLQTFIDMNALGMQIGAVPLPGSRGERIAVLLQRMKARRMRRRPAS